METQAPKKKQRGTLAKPRPIGNAATKVYEPKSPFTPAPPASPAATSAAAKPSTAIPLKTASSAGSHTPSTPEIEQPGPETANMPPSQPTDRATELASIKQRTSLGEAKYRLRHPAAPIDPNAGLTEEQIAVNRGAKASGAFGRNPLMIDTGITQNYPRNRGSLAKKKEAGKQPQHQLMFRGPGGIPTVVGGGGLELKRGKGGGWRFQDVKTEGGAQPGQAGATGQSDVQKALWNVVNTGSGSESVSALKQLAEMNNTKLTGAQEREYKSITTDLAAAEREIQSIQGRVGVEPEDIEKARARQQELIDKRDAWHKKAGLPAPTETAPAPEGGEAGAGGAGGQVGQRPALAGQPGQATGPRPALAQTPATSGMTDERRASLAPAPDFGGVGDTGAASLNQRRQIMDKTVKQAIASGQGIQGVPQGIQLNHDEQSGEYGYFDTATNSFVIGIMDPSAPNLKFIPVRAIPAEEIEQSQPAQ